MQQISSSATMFYRLFIPTFLIVFFIIGNMALWMSEVETQTNLVTLRLFFALGFVLILLVLYRTSYRIMRIDCDEDYFYVSNYFRTAKYSYNQIARVEEGKFLLFNIARIYLNGKGAFGSIIRFKPNSIRYNTYFKPRYLASAAIEKAI